MLFKVLAGSHSQDGIIYNKDDIINTNINLDRLFKNKFKKLSEDNIENVKNPKISSPPPTEGVDQLTKASTIKKTPSKFKKR